MLQQTTVVAVKNYFAAFTARWPTAADLAAAPLEEVLSAWAGLGYYARARNLHACAIQVVEKHGGIFPRTAAALRDLPGIGDYTSAAIAAICHDEPVPVLDGNVERVLARFYALPRPVREEKPFLRKVLGEVVPARAGDFAQAMMDLGATICAPRRANCLLCPLEPDCLGARLDPLAFPAPAEKKLKPQRFGHAFVIRHPDGSVFLRRRGPKGMLAKMTEVPGSAWTEQASDPDFPFSANWMRAGTVDHVFTHFRLSLDVWRVTDARPLAEGWRSAPETLGGEALPSLFRKVLRQAGLDP